MLIRYWQENISSQQYKSQASRYSTMLDGNVLLRQKRDEVPEGTLSCPDRNMEVFNQLRHYEGLRLLPSVCGWKLIQQTLIIDVDIYVSKYLAENYEVGTGWDNTFEYVPECIYKFLEHANITTIKELRDYLDNNNYTLKLDEFCC